MIHSDQDRSYYSLYMNRYDLFIATGDGRSGVYPRTTHFSYQEFHFFTYRYVGGFSTYQNHCTSPPLFNHSVEIIQLVMLVVLNLVFMLVMVEAVLVQ